MRTAKDFVFRVWTQNKMYHPMGWCGVCEALTYDNDIIMQWTGLLDKNGKEIFEGDIMNFKSDKWSGDGYLCGTVGFHPENARVVEWDNCQFKLNNFIVAGEIGTYEVIGNIYEHSNLLKEGEPK